MFPNRSLGTSIILELIPKCSLGRERKHNSTQFSTYIRYTHSISFPNSVWECNFRRNLVSQYLLSPNRSLGTSKILELTPKCSLGRERKYNSTQFSTHIRYTHCNSSPYVPQQEFGNQYNTRTYPEVQLGVRTKT